MSNFNEPTSLNWGEPTPKRARLLPLLAVGAATFAAGGALVGGYVLFSGGNSQVAAVAVPAEDATASQVAALLPQSPATPAAGALDETQATAEIATRSSDPQLFEVPTDLAAAETASADPEGADPLPVADAGALTDEGGSEDDTAQVLPVQADAPDLSPAAMLNDAVALAGASSADGIRALMTPAVQVTDAAASEQGDEAALLASGSEDLTLDEGAVLVSSAGADQADAALIADAPQAAARETADTAAEPTSVTTADAAPAPARVIPLETAEDRLALVSTVVKGVRDITEIVATGAYRIEPIENPDGVIIPRLVLNGLEAETIEMEAMLVLAAERDLYSVPYIARHLSGEACQVMLMLSVVQRELSVGGPAEQAEATRLSEALQSFREPPVVEMSTPVDTGTSPAVEQRVYTVQSGDSLAYIALQFYGDTNEYLRIFEANREQIEDPERIQVGQRLVVPAA